MVSEIENEKDEIRSYCNVTKIWHTNAQDQFVTLTSNKCIYQNFILLYNAYNVELSDAGSEMEK